MKNRFDEPHQYEAIKEWQIENLKLPNGNCTVCLYVCTDKGEKYITLDREDAEKMIDALSLAVGIHRQRGKA